MNGERSSPNTWWRCASSVFRWLLWLYPRRFREAYGSQMLHDFRDLWEEAAQQQGAVGVCRVCWETLGDLAVTAIAEQLRKEQAMERRIVVRIGAALIWATAVLEALSVQVGNLPFPDALARFLTLNWTQLGFDVVFLVGLVGLQLKYRQRIPWYIGLIGSGATLAFFGWRLLPTFWFWGTYLLSGGYPSAKQIVLVFFMIDLVYSVGMLVWGISTLVKGVLPPWIAVLLMLFGLDYLLLWLVRLFQLGIASPLWLDSHLRWLVVQSGISFIPYILVRCVLLAGLGYALWVHTRPGSAPSEPNAAGPASPNLPAGVDPAV